MTVNDYKITLKVLKPVLPWITLEGRRSEMGDCFFTGKSGGTKKKKIKSYFNYKTLNIDLYQSLTV